MIHRQIRELLSNCNFLPKEKLSVVIYIYIYIKLDYNNLPSYQIQSWIVKVKRKKIQNTMC